MRAPRLSRLLVGAVCSLGDPVAHAAPEGPVAPQAPASSLGLPALPGAADGGFRMEPRPPIDDVFGDASDYRRTIDRFLQLSGGMQRTRDQFGRAVQSALHEVAPRPPSEKDKDRDKKEKAHRCPEADVARPYARALVLGQRYLRVGRELARRFEQVRDFDRLGETVGLTPDYRDKVKRVFADYAALLVDYREMKVAFHDQLTDELKFAGCDLDHLVARANAMSTQGGDKGERPSSEGDTAPSAPDPDAASSEGDAAPFGDTTNAASMPAPAVPAADRSGILFYVDNTRCGGGSHVELDGRAIGDVPPATRTAFQTTPGPHELCLLPVDAPTTTEGTPTAAPHVTAQAQKKCGDAGTLRRSYLHEGWTIALRCGD